MSIPPIGNDTLEFGSISLYGAKATQVGKKFQVSYDVIETTPPEKAVPCEAPFQVDVNLNPSKIEVSNEQGRARVKRESIPPTLDAETIWVLNQLEKNDQMIAKLRKQKGLPTVNYEPGQHVNGVKYIKDPQKGWVAI